MEIVLLLATGFLALSNGANDNFKGFATVWGSHVLGYFQALGLASVATLAGGLASWWLAPSLALQFNRDGVAPEVQLADLPVLASVATAAAVTVFLATRLGLPISTTHALIGGLVGAGFAVLGGALHWAPLIEMFLLPLLLSPLAAAILSVLARGLLRSHSTQQECLCITRAEFAPVATVGRKAFARVSPPALLITTEADCAEATVTVRVPVRRILDRVHILSAMGVCFARGVNDVPKLAGLLATTRVLSPESWMTPLTLLVVLGGVLFTARVAHTMSQRLTRMDHVSGLAANLITASLVLLASKLALPVSTTHVAIGSIVGVGADTRRLNTHVLRDILLSWVLTLPLAAGLAWILAVLFRGGL